MNKLASWKFTTYLLLDFKPSTIMHMLVIMSYNGAQLILTIWVTWWVSCWRWKRRHLSFADAWDRPRVLVGSVLLILLVFCVMLYVLFVFVLCLVCSMLRFSLACPSLIPLRFSLMFIHNTCVLLCFFTITTI